MLHRMKNLFQNKRKQQQEELEKYKQMVQDYEDELEYLKGNHVDDNYFIAPSVLTELPYYQLKVGKNILSLLDGKTEFYEGLNAFKESLSDELGLDIPFLLIKEEEALLENEFSLFIREKLVLSSYLKLDKTLAIKMPYTTKTVKGSWADESLFGENAIWVSKEETEALVSADYFTPNKWEIILRQIEKATNDNLKLFIDRPLVLSLFDTYDYNWASQSELEKLEIRPYVVQKLLEKLIQERYPIKNFLSILEFLIEFRTNHASSGEIQIDEVSKLIKNKIKN